VCISPLFIATNASSEEGFQITSLKHSQHLLSELHSLFIAPKINLCTTNGNQESGYVMSIISNLMVSLLVDVSLMKRIRPSKENCDNISVAF
jgi:hypothetical protein